MATYKIPTQEKKWIQPNRGDILGNLWATWNMDFDSALGKVRVSRRIRINTDDTDDAQLTTPMAFVRSSADATDRWWALCGTVLFKTAGTDPSAAFTQDAIASSPTTATVISSDMISFNGKLYVSLPTDIAELDGGTWDVDWWTTVPSGTAPTTGIAHPLHVTTRSNLFLVGDGNLVHVMDKDESAKNSRIILPLGFEVIWIRSNESGTWIGARNKESGEAEAFFWDESAENYNRSYGLKSDRTFTGVMKDGIPYTINGEGQLLGFSGSGFEEVAVLPLFAQPNKKWQDSNTVNRCVQRNGMAVIDNKIHISLNSLIGNAFASALDNFGSGIYTFDKDEGLRHKYSFSQYDGTEKDYGIFILSQSGALVPTDVSKGLFLAGATIHTNNTTQMDAIFYLDTNDSIVKRGYFITGKFPASKIEDVWKDLTASFKAFENSTDRIIGKYRKINDPNFPIFADGTWTDTNTFTTTVDLSDVVAGNEVEILRGTGAGTTAHVESISFSTPTYTVNLDETITNATSTSQFLFNNWTKFGTISTQSITYQELAIDDIGAFVQLKVELRGKGASPELEGLKLTSEPNT